MPTKPEARRNLRAIIAETLAVMQGAPSAAKSVLGYADDYLVELTTIATAVINGDQDAGDMAQVHRRLLKQYAEETYIEGMWESKEFKTREEIPAAFEDDDEKIVEDWINGQREHVAQYARDTQKAGKLLAVDPDKASTAQADIFRRADQWAASLRSLGDMGRASALTNEMGQWRLGKTEEHCNTCAELANGKPHRLKWFVARGYIPRQPGNESLDCGGWNCDCGVYSVKTGKRIL